MASPTGPRAPSASLLSLARFHGFALSIVTVILSLSLLPVSDTYLALSRAAIAQGEWWRVVTSQLAHLGPAHALMNAAGFFIISFSFRPDFSPVHEATVLFTSMIAVAAGILLLNPEIHWYMGLSGAIYGLLIHHLVAGAREQRRLAWLFIAGVTGKLAYEQWFAPPDRLTEAIIGGMVAVDAHLYGACWGAICGLISRGGQQVFKQRADAPANSPQQ